MTTVARVLVMPKAAILDPQGKAVASSLHALGYDEVVDARLGKVIELDLGQAGESEARARVEQMCRRLLANEVIEEYSFEVETRQS